MCLLIHIHVCTGLYLGSDLISLGLRATQFDAFSYSYQCLPVMVANRPYHTINTWYVPAGRRAAELCLWMQSTGWWSSGQLDAVYEKSVSVVINISPLMCHHVECEHSGGWLKCRGLAGTICLYIHMKCTCLPRWELLCVFLYFWFDVLIMCPLLQHGHVFIFFIPRPTPVLHMLSLFLAVWVVSWNYVLKVFHCMPSMYFSYPSVLLCLSY